MKQKIKENCKTCVGFSVKIQQIDLLSKWEQKGLILTSSRLGAQMQPRSSVGLQRRQRRGRGRLRRHGGQQPAGRRQREQWQGRLHDLGSQHHVVSDKALAKDPLLLYANNHNNGAGSVPADDRQVRSYISVFLSVCLPACVFDILLSLSIFLTSC